MAGPTYLTKMDVEYILNGCWICKKSPTGAHYWKEVPSVKPGMFVCIYCFESREFPLTFSSKNIGI